MIQERQPLEGLKGRTPQLDGPGVQVATLFVTERVRVTIVSSDNGRRLFGLSVEDSHEVMTAAEVRAMAAALRGLAEAR